MTRDDPSQKSGLNECSSCRSWKVDHGQSKSRILSTSTSGEKMGLCVGGGFDGSHTRSDETCSMWRPLMDKHRVMPIFYPKEVDD
jgi:hypothetical protein